VDARTEPALTNPRAERVKAVRALSGRSARDRYGRFLVEGPQAVREAVRHAPDDVQDLYLSLASADRYPEIVGDAACAVSRCSWGPPRCLRR